MQIYQSEIDAGLAEQISNSKISIACEMFTKENFKAQAGREKLLEAITKANPDQRDLFYKHSILASVGWNANDDVFDRIETWNARNTPVDKQINFMHNELDIIGHSTQSSVYDINGSLIPDDTPVDKLPERFDVVTEFVLYQMWDIEARQELMEKLISEIAQDKWYVSMECRFSAFDYAIIDKDKGHRTVARTADTAFLTKHLKAFGGTGEYEGRKIGRLIRNFFFSGQGIVDKPANPRSIIFNRAIAFNSQGSLIIKGDKKMEDELKKQVAALEAQLAHANKQKYEETIANLKQELADAQKASESVAKAAKDKEDDEKAKHDKMKTECAAKDAAIAQLSEELKAVNEKLSAAQTELDAGKKAQAAADRVNKLTVAGLTADEAKVEAAKWDALNDAQFADIVAIHQAKTEAVKTAKAKTATETVVTPTLEAAVVEPNAGLNSANAGVDNVEAERKAVEDFFGTAMKFCGHAKAAAAKKN